MFPVIKAYCHITWLHNAQVIFRKLAFKPAISAEINGKSICLFPDLFAAVCVDAVLEKAYRLGVKELPQGHNWFELPSGLCIEVIAGKTDVLKEIIEKKPWIE